MRTSIILGYVRGAGVTELLAAGETSIEEQISQFKEARQNRTHDKFERVERWESDRGRVQYHDFDAPPVAKSTAHAQPPAAPPPVQTPPEPSEPATQEAPATPPPVEGEVAAEQPDGEQAEDFEVKTKADDDEPEADGDKPKAKGAKKRK